MNHSPRNVLVPKLPCCLGVSDPTFGRSWALRCNASEHQANIVAAVCLDRRVQKDLLENILLRVTAAQAVHLVEDWCHEIDGAGVFASPMRQHRL